MPKTWFNVRAAAADDAPVAASVEIFDEVGYWGVTAKDFVNAIKPFKGKALDVSINSPGGDVFAGIGIYNALRAHGGPVTTRVSGVAASAASIILMAGDKRVMPENTMVMVHNPWTIAAGNADELRDAADVLDKIGTTLVNVYVARTGKSEDEVKAMLAEDTWLTAEESLAGGFVDEVTPSFEARALFDLERLPENVRSVFAAAKPVDPVLPESPLTALLVDEAKAQGLEAYVPVFATDVRIVDAATAKETIADAKSIQAYAKLAGLEDHADRLIKDRKSIADARRALADARAQADALAEVDTSTPSKPAASTTEFSATKLWAEIKATRSKK